MATGEAVPRASSHLRLRPHPRGGLSTQILAEAKPAGVLPCSKWFSPENFWSSDCQRQSPRAWEVTVSLGLTTGQPVSVQRAEASSSWLDLGKRKLHCSPMGILPPGPQQHRATRLCSGCSLKARRNTAHRHGARPSSRAGGGRGDGTLEMPLNICRVGVRRMGPDSFQWCPATGQGATGTN